MLLERKEHCLHEQRPLFYLIGSKLNRDIICQIWRRGLDMKAHSKTPSGTYSLRGVFDGFGSEASTYKVKCCFCRRWFRMRFINSQNAQGVGYEGGSLDGYPVGPWEVDTDDCSQTAWMAKLTL